MAVVHLITGIGLYGYENGKTDKRGENYIEKQYNSKPKHSLSHSGI